MGVGNSLAFVARGTLLHYYTTRLHVGPEKKVHLKKSDLMFFQKKSFHRNTKRK